jgi:hypothetical protein
MEEPNAAPNNPNNETENTTGTTDKSPFYKFLEHQGNAAQETVKALQGLLPPEFREHGRKAREEFLQSFKVLIDGVQEAVNAEMEKAKAARAERDSKDNDGPSTTGKSKVKVEVS